MGLWAINEPPSLEDLKVSNDEWCRYQETIKAIEESTVARDTGSWILDLNASFEQRFNEITECSTNDDNNSNDDPLQQCYRMEKLGEAICKDQSKRSPSEEPFPWFLRWNTLKQFSFPKKSACKVGTCVAGPKDEKAAKNDFIVIHIALKHCDIKECERYGYVKDPQKSKRDVSERLSLKLLVKFDHIDTRRDRKNEKIIPVGYTSFLDEKWQKVDSYTADSAECLLGYQTIEARELVKLEEGEQTYDEKNQAVCPFINGNAGYDCCRSQ